VPSSDFDPLEEWPKPFCRQLLARLAEEHLCLPSELHPLLAEPPRDPLEQHLFQRPQMAQDPKDYRLSCCLCSPN
jgi:hypothetical protein